MKAEFEDADYNPRVQETQSGRGGGDVDVGRVLMPADLGFSDHQIHLGLMDQSAKRQEFLSGQADGCGEISEGCKVQPFTLSAGGY